MYVGESERLVREVFIRARRARPCVIFFDELDSLAPARGRGSDSGGVMDRIVSQLLAEIDCAQGGSGTDDIFIIGATNRPDLLDPALLRPGRLDKLLYVGIAAEPSDRLKVLSALTRKFCLASDVDLMALSAACPARLTGADMYGLCSSAWMIGLKRHIASNPSKNDSSIIVNHQDFVDALSSIQPSLTISDIQQYEQMQQSYVHQ
jgi:peroxin-6